LNAVADQPQSPALNAAGVTFLNTRLRNAIISRTDSGVFKVFLDGQVSPAPPPNLAFRLTAQLNLTVVVIEEVELPGDCSNPFE